MGLYYKFECDVLERDGVLSHSLWILTGRLFAVALPVNFPSKAKENVSQYSTY